MLSGQSVVNRLGIKNEIPIQEEALREAEEILPRVFFRDRVLRRQEVL